MAQKYKKVPNSIKTFTKLKEKNDTEIYRVLFALFLGWLELYLYFFSIYWGNLSSQLVWFNFTLDKIILTNLIILILKYCNFLKMNKKIIWPYVIVFIRKFQNNYERWTQKIIKNLNKIIILKWLERLKINMFKLLYLKDL